MTPPIIINEHGDVVFFKSVEEAERSLEAIDVESHEYDAYDAEGRVLQLSVKTGQTSTLLGLLRAEVKTVAIAPLDDQPQDARDRLRAVLADFLSRQGGATESLGSESLESLLRLSIEHAGFAR